MITYTHLRIFRPSTGTTVTVPAPFDIHYGPMSEQTARSLNKFVDLNYPGFEICGFLEAV
jgi:hypothetical protein